MESEVSDDQPLSPKKKLKPNSTSNAEVSESNCCHSPCNSSEKLDVADSASNHVNANGLAPTRSGRIISSSSHNEESSPVTDQESSRDSTQNDNANVRNNILSIQEEEVSSSENVNFRTSSLADTDGDADSLTKEEPGEALSNNSDEEKQL